MKTNGILKRDYWGLGILSQLFNQSRNKNKSSSLENLKEEISTDDYREKVKYLIKQDLLLKYNSKTVEKGLENFVIQITVENFPQLEVVKEEGPVSLQEPSKPVERIKEIVNEEDQQEVRKVIREEPLGIQKQPTPIIKNYEILSNEKQQEVEKVQSRVPGWFRKPHQINSRILIAYMDLLGEDKSVPLHKLEAACRSIKTFQNNYIQMKSFGERNHAKVFEEAGGRVTLWEPVRDFILKEYNSYMRQAKN